MGWDIFVELSETCSTEGMRVFALIGTFDDVTNGMFAKKLSLAIGTTFLCEKVVVHFFIRVFFFIHNYMYLDTFGFVWGDSPI